MSTPKSGARPTIEEIRAAPPADRLRLAKAFTAPIFEEAARRRAAGICGECEEQVAGASSPLGDTYCSAHAREIEIEFLKFEQEHEDA